MEEYIKLLELPEEFDLNDLKMAYRKKKLKLKKKLLMKEKVLQNISQIPL